MNSELGIGLFDGLIGQPHAARLLTAALARKRPRHAYLFAGPPGSGKRTAALKFGAALCCRKDGCGSCSTCRKAARGTHPDIAVIEPAGSQIMVDQIREVNRTLNMRPHESRARVFIIGDAGALNAAGANAFLKSLEEPPPFVFFLLLASRPREVLPTIVSRCQIIRFSRAPASDVESYLFDKYQVSAPKAEAFARVSGGNLGLAEALWTDAKLAGRRELYLGIAARLARGGSQDAAAMAAAVQSALLEAAAAAEGSGDELPDWPGRSPKQRQQDAHRRTGAAQKWELALALDMLASWYRDMAAVAAGARDSVLNRDYELELDDLALPSRLDNYLAAVGVIENTRKKLVYNIDLGLVLMAMFYELAEVL